MAITTSATSSTPVSSAAATLASISASNKANAQKIITAMGSGSGIDVASLAKNLVDAERAPLAGAINTRIAKNDAKVSGMSAVMFMLKELNTKLTALKDRRNFNLANTNNSTPSAFSVSSNASAVPANHSVEVAALAKAQRSMGASAFASTSTSINSGAAFRMHLTGTNAGVAVGTPEGATISNVAFGTAPATTDFKTFSVTVAGTIRNITPSPVTATLADLATNLQVQLRALDGSTDLIVTAAGTSLSVASASARTIGSPSLSKTSTILLNLGASVGTPAGNSISGVAFGSTPAATDFQSFSVSLGGTTRTIVPIPATPTLTDLAANLQSQLRQLEGTSDLSISVSGTTLSLTSASGRAISAPSLIKSNFEATPAGVVAAINAKKLGVTAELVNTGASVNPYKIILTGDTGAAKGFTLTSTQDLSISPAVSYVQGADGGTTETASINFSALTAGQSVTLGGLTYTSTANTSAAQVATAFANLAANASTGQGTGTGSYSGTASANFSSGAASGSSVVFTATSAATAVLDLAVSASLASGISSTVTQGDSLLGAEVTETASVVFTALTAGQKITVGGLTYTSTGASTAAQVAAAFASLADNAGTGAGTLTGSYSGNFSGFTSTTPSGASNNTVVMTSTTVNTNVTDLVVASSSVTELDFSSALQLASDASVSINGVAYTRASNSISDIITDVTLDLKTLTTSAASLSLVRDTSSIKTKISEFVIAYNDANSILTEVSNPKSSMATFGATLVGDSTIGALRQQLRGMVSGNSSTPGNSISSLWQMGLSIDRFGVMSTDAAKLDSALAKNFDDVVLTFTGNQNDLSLTSTLAGGLAGDAVKKISNALSTSGPLLSSTNNATKQNASYQTKLIALETRMTALLARYTKQFATMDSLVGRLNSQKTSLQASFDGMMSIYTNRN